MRTQSSFGLFIVLACCLGLNGAVTAQCASSPSAGGSSSGGSASTGATQSFSAGRPSSSVGNGFTRGFARPTASFQLGSVPQVGSFNQSTAMTGVNSFHAQQVANYRALAASAVRNRRSASRQQEMLATNAERAYKAGLSAEKSGRSYSALKQYERAASIAPGSIAAKYAEEAITRLNR